MSTSISRVGVLGCGLMGSGIAEVTARSGLDVVVLEADGPSCERGLARVAKSLARAVDSGKLSPDDRDAALSRIVLTADPDELHDRQVVIEALPEILKVKLAAMRQVDRIVTAPDAILASNTSSIPISRLAAVTQRPEHVLGMHFFNPVPVLALVELVTSLLTAPATRARAEAFATEALGKHVVHSQDRAGFIVNALLVPYMLSAIRMAESGFASVADIDDAMVHGCAHPMGPLRLTDLVGLDTTMHVAISLYDEFKEPLYAPPPLLQRMVEAGLLGRKSGRGFYDYRATGA